MVRKVSYNGSKGKASSRNVEVGAFYWIYRGRLEWTLGTEKNAGR